MYIARDIEESLKSASMQFPAIFLTGPRQAGKTTLLKQVFPDYNYVNLENPEIRQWAIEQPSDFLQNNPWPLIIDEAQYAPALFSYLQLIIDHNQQSGMFIITGSQNFLLMEKISQSLAGRSAVMSLLPFSINELSSQNLQMQTNEQIIRGFFPSMYQSVTDISLFYGSYLNTYVERDLRQLLNISNLNDFHRFVKLCAGRAGQLLNLNSLATEAGIAYNTCKSWMSLLTAAYIIQLVQPFYKNYNKRIVKTPKLFFTDTGLLCELLGIRSKETLAVHPFRGEIFENLVYIELLKYNLNFNHRASIWFWRDNHGTEIDFLIEKELMMSAVEAKSGTNIHDSYLRNLSLFKKYNPSLKQAYLIYDGQIYRTINETQFLNWKNISKVFE